MCCPCSIIRNCARFAFFLSTVFELGLRQLLFSFCGCQLCTRSPDALRKISPPFLPLTCSTSFIEVFFQSSSDPGACCYPSGFFPKFFAASTSIGSHKLLVFSRLDFFFLTLFSSSFDYLFRRLNRLLFSFLSFLCVRLALVVLCSPSSYPPVKFSLISL